ncbi:MAG: hypothetical protein PUA69_06700, partial [Erysipelotrichaceae bacterium]|nr:hypothetical protein [Erysipelotrichaceae bacterium]
MSRLSVFFYFVGDSPSMPIIVACGLNLIGIRAFLKELQHKKPEHLCPGRPLMFLFGRQWSLCHL